VIAAVGGAVYLAIDLAAIAHECGIGLALGELIEVMADTPQRWSDPCAALRDKTVGDILGMSDNDERSVTSVVAAP